MTQIDVNVKNQGGNVQNVPPGGGVMGGGPGLRGAGSMASLNEMSQYLRQISLDSARQGSVIDRSMKTAGIKFNLAGVLKQSQLFTGLIGSLFQILGAFVDVILAAFMPILIPTIRKIAGWIPWVKRWIADPLKTAVGWLVSIKDAISFNLENEKNLFGDLIDNIPGVGEGTGKNIMDKILSPEGLLLEGLGILLLNKFIPKLWSGAKGAAPVLGNMAGKAGGPKIKMFQVAGIALGFWGLHDMPTRLTQAFKGELGPDKMAALTAVAGETALDATAVLAQNPVYALLGEILQGINNMWMGLGDPTKGTLLQGLGGDDNVYDPNESLTVNVNGMTQTDFNNQNRIVDIDTRYANGSIWDAVNE